LGDRVCFENLALDGVAFNETLINLNSASYCSIKNCFFDVGSIGLHLNSASNNTIMENCFLGNNVGVRFDGTNENNIISLNQFKDNNDDTSGTIDSSNVLLGNT